MDSGIFLIQDDGSLVSMNEKDYDSEDFLQELLEKYPSLLAGDQMESSDPRRWLLVCREMGIPGEEEGGDRWSVDHLFLDQDSVPTLIEVKRSTDTRIRREVVGQMLDYAANSVVYWPAEKIRSQFERQCESSQRDPDEELTNFLSDGMDIEKFWDQVKTNLQAGKIRMVFVADQIPNELKRIVEFLNEQMDPAQVLAVEIKQYVGKGLRALVPRVLGQTAEAEKKKRTNREQREWDEPSFFADLEERKGSDQACVARTIYDWFRAKTDHFDWGKGAKNGFVAPNIGDEGGGHRLLKMYTNGHVTILFGQMKSGQSSFSDKTKRTELLQRLNKIEGMTLPADSFDKWPSINMTKLANKQTLDQFISTMEWAVEQIEGNPGEAS